MKEHKFQQALLKIAKMLKVSKKDMLSSNRKQHIVDARHFLYYIGNKKLDIGVCYMQTYLRRMGYGISHPSIIHGVQKVERMLEDTDVKNFVDEVVG